MKIYKGKRHWYLETDTLKKKFTSEADAVLYAEANGLIEKKEVSESWWDSEDLTEEA
jgi:hypothetical protein